MSQYHDHAFDIAFSVISTEADSNNISKQSLIAGLLMRVRDIIRNDEITEAIGGAFDSCETTRTDAESQEDIPQILKEIEMSLHLIDRLKTNGQIPCLLGESFEDMVVWFKAMNRLDQFVAPQQDPFKSTYPSGSRLFTDSAAAAIARIQQRMSTLHAPSMIRHAACEAITKPT
jgi:hypothetical protein